MSNKILIIFFGTILTYTLMAFAEIRISGESRILNEKNSIAETISLDGIKYVVFDDRLNQWIHLSGSNKPRIEMKSKSGDMMSKLKYELKGDTLYINEMNDEENHFDLSIFVPRDGFSGFTSSSAYVELSDIKQPGLSINQVNGRVDLEEDVDIGRLILNSNSDATLEMTASRVDTLSIQVDDSSLRLYGKIRRLEGTLENSSSVYASDVDEMMLKKDKGSSIRIMD
ncbi:MAG: hypothetical protein AB8B73_03940 [Ekhidna sp.]